MYQTLSKNTIFSSKYLNINQMYDISAAHHCIRIQPYLGDYRFDFLRRCCAEQQPPKLMIPAYVTAAAGIKGKVYVVQIDETFYLMHPDFRGDPETADYEHYPDFSFLPAPDNSFFKEADAFPVEKLTPLKPITRKVGLPSEMRKQMGIKGECELSVTVYDHYGRRWIELRPSFRGKYPRMNDRISGTSFHPALTGVTFNAPYNSGISLAGVCYGWDDKSLVAWFSKKRNAIIVEGKPELCAVCGTPIRTISREHFRAKSCDNCLPHLGAGKAIDAIISAQRAIEGIEEAISM